MQVCRARKKNVFTLNTKPQLPVGTTPADVTGCWDLKAHHFSRWPLSVPSALPVSTF